MVVAIFHFLRSSLTFCFNLNCSDKVIWLFFSQFQSLLFVSRKCVFIMNGMLMGTIDNHQVTYTDVLEVVLCEYSHHFLSVTSTQEKSISEALCALNIIIYLTFETVPCYFKRKVGSHCCKWPHNSVVVYLSLLMCHLIWK